VLEDPAREDIAFLNDNLNKFMDAAKKRPEAHRLSTTFLPAVPRSS